MTTMLSDFPILSTCEDELKLCFVNLEKTFEYKYGMRPDFFVRTPGRVNLIGEHVDYNGYSVCPMAIKQCVIVAIKSIDESKIILSNVNKAQYKNYSGDIHDFEFRFTYNMSRIKETKPEWHDYVLCGIKGILEITTTVRKTGIIFHMDGSIPVSSGLSSSSALVCASALAMCVVLNKNLSKTEISELTAKSERYIGTEGGGMDQAIIYNGKAGTASHISFGPLRLCQIEIPPNGTFVIARSMVTKNKAASNDFNSRVVECRLASLIIAKEKGLQNWPSCIKLAEVQEKLRYKLEEIIQVVKDLLHDGYYEKSEVSDILGISEKELEDKFLTKNTKQLNQFKLKPRALHVFGEALRTENFCKICSTTKSLEDLGRLMFESHYSLKDLYECSHPELDKLVMISKSNGALGARLTGAGWGGCMVALVHSKDAEDFVQKVYGSFYMDKIKSEENIDNYIFITKPCCGASLFELHIIKN